jgi:hypothetical protein
MKNKALTVLVAVGMMVSLASATVLSKNGIAIDSATGLEWQDNRHTVTVQKNWNDAQTYCENLILGGFSDWRLPNIYELTTLLDNTKKEQPYIIDGFQFKESSGYWSSTTYKSYKDYTWFVHFGAGGVSSGDKYNYYYVRCVKSEQLKFDNLALLKKEEKVKVSQKRIDELSPKEVQKQSATTRSYNSWTTGYKDKRIDSYLPSSYEATDIKCSDGIKGTVFNYYGRATSYRYIVNVTNSFASFDEAANYICGNK